MPDGSLTPRSMEGAVIEDKAVAIQQVLSMVKMKSVTAITGEIVPIKAETICIHGDHEGAASFAKALHQTLTTEGFTIKST